LKSDQRAIKFIKLQPTIVDLFWQLQLTSLEQSTE